jgi:hypothetical protein
MRETCQDYSTPNTVEQPSIDQPEAPAPECLTEIKFLATSWLDQYEKQVFEGKTVRDLLHQEL